MFYNTKWKLSFHVYNPVVVKSKSWFILQVILKTSDDRIVWPLHLSITANVAIRIVWHSAEAVHFHHNIRYIRQEQSRSTILSMRIINPNLSITHPSIGTFPVSLVSQPWPSVILGTAHVDNHHEVASAQTSVAREPILRYINFQSSPIQIRVLWLYGKTGMVSHPNTTISFIKG
jgi:hypothetical protein